MKLFQTKVLVSAWAKSLFKNKKKHPGLDSTNCPSQYLKVKVLVEQVNLLVNRKRQLAQVVMILQISLVWVLQFQLRVDEKIGPFKTLLGQATMKPPILIRLRQRHHPQSLCRHSKSHQFKDNPTKHKEISKKRSKNPKISSTSHSTSVLDHTTLIGQKVLLRSLLAESLKHPGPRATSMQAPVNMMLKKVLLAGTIVSQSASSNCYKSQAIRQAQAITTPNTLNHSPEPGSQHLTSPSPQAEQAFKSPLHLWVQAITI